MTEVVHLPLGVSPRGLVSALMYDRFPGGTVNPPVGSAAERVREMIPEVIGAARVVCVGRYPLAIAHASGLLGHPALGRPGSRRAGGAPGRWSPASRLAALSSSRTAPLFAPPPPCHPGAGARSPVQAPYCRALLTDPALPPVRVAEDMYARSGRNLHFRSRADIARFFSGLELVPPGTGPPVAAHAGEWCAGDPVLAGGDGSRWSYCGVGRVQLPGGPHATAAGKDWQLSQPQQHQQMEEL